MLFVVLLDEWNEGGEFNYYLSIWVKRGAFYPTLYPLMTLLF